MLEKTKVVTVLPDGRTYGGFPAEVVDDKELHAKRWICIKRVNMGDIIQTELGLQYEVLAPISETSYGIQIINNRHVDGSQNNRSGKSPSRPVEVSKQTADQEDRPASGKGDIAPSGAAGGAEEQRADNRQEAGEDTSTDTVET